MENKLTDAAGMGKGKMMGKPRDKIRAACKGKIKHRTYFGAAHARDLLLLKHGGEKVNIYKCVYCDFYHLGRDYKYGHPIKKSD